MNFFKGPADKILPELMLQTNADKIVWNRCYEPWRMTRDMSIKQHIKELGIEVKTASSGLTEEEEQLVKLSLFPEPETESIEETTKVEEDIVESEDIQNTETITSGVRYALLGWFNGDALDGLKRIPRIALHENLNEMGWTYDNKKNT